MSTKDIIKARAIELWQANGKTAVPDMMKVGPHGYIHGWIKVGPGSSDAIRATARGLPAGPGTAQAAKIMHETADRIDQGAGDSAPARLKEASSLLDEDGNAKAARDVRRHARAIKNHLSGKSNDVQHNYTRGFVYGSRPGGEKPHKNAVFVPAEDIKPGMKLHGQDEHGNDTLHEVADVKHRNSRTTINGRPWHERVARMSFTSGIAPQTLAHTSGVWTSKTG